MITINSRVNKKIVLYAFIMILLIISLPIVSAVRVSDVVTTSSSGVENVVAEDDSVHFDITVDLEGQEEYGLGPADVITNGLLVVKGSSEYEVSECSWLDEDNGLVSCTKDLSITTSVSNPVYYFDVVLSDYAYSPRPLLYLDTTPPLYSEISLKAKQNGNYISFDLSAKDHANYNSPSICAGLYSYSFTLKELSSTSTNNIGTGYFEGNCSESTSGNLEPGANLKGTYQLCVSVSDTFENVAAPKCTNLALDLSPPEKLSFEANTLSGNPLNDVISIGGENIVFKAVITDSESIDISRSYLMINDEDQSSFTLESSALLINKTKYTLVAEGFVEPKATSVVAHIYDVNGNELQISNLFAFKEDSTGPALISISGRVNQGSKIFAKNTDSLLATFKEEGRGMYLAKTSLRIGGHLFSATNCTKTGSSWTCYYDIDLNGLSEGEYEVSADASTTDDLGNQITDIGSGRSLIIDKSSPSISSVQVQGITNIGTLPVVAANGRVYLNITYADDSPVSAIVDFSNLRTPDNEYDETYNIVETNCNDETKECLITSDVVGSGGISKDVFITLTDIAGNQINVTQKVKVLTVDGESEVWEGSFTSSPTAWDREVSEVINQRAYVQVQFNTDVDNMQVVDVVFDECFSPDELSEDQGGKEYLVDIEHVGSSEDETSQYLLLEGKRTEILVTELVSECRFTIVSYSDETVYIGEEEIVPVKIGFFNNPSGMPDEEIGKKIDNAVADTQGMFETLDQVYSFLKWLKVICTIYNTIRSLAVGIGTILGLLSVDQAAVMTIPIVGPAIAQGINQVEHGICRVNNGMETKTEAAELSFLDLFCGWVSCDLSLGGLLVNGLDVQAGWAQNLEKLGTLGGASSMDKQLATQAATANGADLGDKYQMNVLDKHGFSVFDSDSLISQILKVCLVGIFEYFHKWRDIKCQKVICLVESAENGIGDEAVCEEIYSSLECQAIWGPIFASLPFAGLLNSLMDFIKTILTDPLRAAIMLAYIGCSFVCESPAQTGTLNNACEAYIRYTGLANSLARLYKMVTNLDSAFSFTDSLNSCEEMDEVLAEYEKRESEWDTHVKEYVGTTSSSSSNSNSGSSTSKSWADGYGGYAG